MMTRKFQLNAFKYLKTWRNYTRQKQKLNVVFIKFKNSYVNLLLHYKQINICAQLDAKKHIPIHFVSANFLAFAAMSLVSQNRTELIEKQTNQYFGSIWNRTRVIYLIKIVALEPTLAPDTCHFWIVANKKLVLFFKNLGFLIPYYITFSGMYSSYLLLDILFLINNILSNTFYIF